MNVPARPRRTRHSTLTRRIVLVNTAVLLLLIAGVLALQSTRMGLVDERLNGIKTEAQIVSSTLAEYATNTDTHTLDLKQAEPLLRQLMAPSKLRGRLYATDGSLAVDTRDLLARNVVQTAELPPIDSWSQTKEFFSRIYDNVMGVRPFTKLDPYFEAGSNGRVYREVNAALAGDMASEQRVDDQNKLVLSVAAPVQRFKAIYGVLLVSTEGGDIDDVLREERRALIGLFLVAILVMLASSVLLSRFIARPVLALADAADRVRSGRSGRETIPSMEGRNDEIGELAASFSAMTRALYDRIDAIESFAADVAHETQEPPHLAQERSGDADAREGRRLAREDDGNRAQRCEADRPADHRHLRCVAPRCRTQPRAQRAGRHHGISWKPSSRSTTSPTFPSACPWN